jgi:hypothetical protein
MLASLSTGITMDSVHAGFPELENSGTRVCISMGPVV